MFAFSHPARRGAAGRPALAGQAGDACCLSADGGYRPLCGDELQPRTRLDPAGAGHHGAACCGSSSAPSCCSIR
ncbi:MAG: hypothetical protein MZV70_72085 [Desulfobacterales bacterium]|nr:hypothetical protein [Desulfobacterales bacterium]